MNDQIILSEEQQRAYNAILKGENLIILGGAGVGKSHIIKKLKQDSPKKAIYLSYTGLASSNIGGSTVNSQFCLKPSNVYEVDKILKYFSETMQGKNNDNAGRLFNLQKLLNSIDLIVIDEISMLRIDMWETIDLICRNFVYKKNCDGSYVTDANGIPIKDNRFFGGIQVVAFGDFFQLPPILPKKLSKDADLNDPAVQRQKAQLDYYNSKYPYPYVFMYKDTVENMKLINLVEIHRQSDKQFIDALNSIRFMDDNIQNALDLLNTRVLPVPKDKHTIVLSSHNESVDNYNFEKMQSLKGKPYMFKAVVKGSAPSTSLLNNLFLKEGAQVMILVNDPAGSYVNGTIGTFLGVSDDSSDLRVLLSDGKEILVSKVTLYNNYFHADDNSGISLKTLGSICQYPLKPAWATTVHKSQGQTFDSLYLLNFHSFAHGQTYVALSRVKSLDGLYLSKPLTIKDIIIDPIVKSVIKY